LEPTGGRPQTNYRLSGKERRETPLIVRIFDKFIENYSAIPGVIVAEPKSSTYIRSLAFRSEIVGIMGFGETKWYLMATHEAVESSRMDYKAVDLYRNCKGMECQLRMKGFIRKQITFHPHESLEKLKHHIPTLHVSDKLCLALERNKKVARLIRRIKPGEVSIRLCPISESRQLENASAMLADDTIQMDIECFNNPSSITWAVILSALYSQVPGVQRKATATIALFEEIFRTIRRETGI